MRKASPFKAVGGDSPGYLVNTGLMAWMLDISERALQDWAQTRSCPRAARGWWDPKAVMAWRLTTEADSGGTDGLALEARIKTASAEFREVKTERERLLKEILEGKYLSAAEVEEEWARRVTEVRASLTAMARQMAGAFTDPETRREVERVAAHEIRAMCDQYARTGRYTPRRSSKA